MKLCYKNIAIFLSLIGMGALTLQACRPDPEHQIPQVNDIRFTIPPGWPEPSYKFEGNPLTWDGFELGRKIFYDPRLSRDESVSCGSCHQQFAAFAHRDHDLSHGVDNLLGTRNSPSMFNLNWHTSYFWDGGVNHLESQPINPIENPVEMDETIPNVIAKMETDPEYGPMFSKAFGSPEINSQRIFKALAQFMGMMISADSPYDRYVNQRPGGDLSASAIRGLNLFRAHCASCHTEPLFSDFSFRDNGLKPNVIRDSGRAHITLKEEDVNKFKVPSLRNLKYSGPYMHDGRFFTLEEVLDHYAHGIEHGPNLDPLLVGGIPLSDQDKTDLLAFLDALNDETFIRDPRFAEYTSPQ